MKPYSLRSIVLTYRMGTALLRRGTLAGAVGLALAGAMPAYATEPSNAELLERIKRLEKKNEDQEKALEGSRISESEPELATRLKAVEFQALSQQKQARTIEALEGITAAVGFTMVAQGANNGATTDNTGESQLNYRADVSVSLPAGEIGNAAGKIFGQFRMGQGNGLESLRPTFSGPNTTAFQLNGVSQPDDSAVLLAQAWYQLDIPLPLGGFKPQSRERLTMNFGKMDPFVFFDQNAAANDETRQFLNNVFVHNALLDAGGDIGADANGFSPGVRLAYTNETRKPLAYGLSLGIFGAGPGAGFNNTFSSPFVIVQADTLQKFFGGLDGNYRLYVWRNGQATPYQDSEDSSLEAHAGWGASIDQRVGDAVTLFGRYGHETRGQVRFDRALALGAQFGGDYWDRAGDALGLALGGQRVSGEFHDNSLTLDANRDGTPDFRYEASGTERVVEMYYRYRLNKRFELTPDVQLIQHPGGNGAAPTMTILGARAQLTF
jgi:high affinity Mn2+ porin